jgi:hypothetical protein
VRIPALSSNRQSNTAPGLFFPKPLWLSAKVWIQGDGILVGAN